MTTTIETSMIVPIRMPVHKDLIFASVGVRGPQGHAGCFLTPGGLMWAQAVSPGLFKGRFGLMGKRLTPAGAKKRYSVVKDRQHRIHKDFK